MTDQEKLGTSFDRETEGYFDKEKEEAPIATGFKAVPFKVALLVPVKLGSVTYKELTVVAMPSVGMLAHLPVSGEVQRFGHYVPMLAAICEVPEEVINALIPRDYQRLMAEVNDFLS